MTGKNATKLLVIARRQEADGRKYEQSEDQVKQLLKTQDLR